MFMNWKIHYHEELGLPKLICTFNAHSKKCDWEHGTRITKLTSKIIFGVGKMAQWVKELVTKPDNLSVTLEPTW